MKLSKTCPICGKVTVVVVDKEAYSNWCNGELIQNAFPDMSPSTREVVRIGTCYSCMEKLYNIPAPGNEKLFGKFLGNCNCCDRKVWEKDIKNGEFICSSCGNNEFE